MHDQVRLLIVQHEPHSGPGTTLEWCQARQVPFRILQAAKGNFPKPLAFERVVVLGGEMNVDDEDIYPWLREEKTFLRGLLAGETPVLGICLGAQLMAEVLGARVSRHAYVEEGWDRIRIFPASGLPGEGSVIEAFQWHGYSFDIPTSATRVFGGSRWENQGFRYGPHLGVQFHPEADETFVRYCFEDTPLKMDEASLSRLRESKDWYFGLLDFLFLKS